MKFVEPVKEEVFSHKFKYEYVKNVREKDFRPIQMGFKYLKQNVSLVKQQGMIDKIIVLLVEDRNMQKI